jgi:hypothetical protein
MCFVRVILSCVLLESWGAVEILEKAIAIATIGRLDHSTSYRLLANSRKLSDWNGQQQKQETSTSSRGDIQ